MFEYIKGLLVELTPTYAVVETNGIGYFVNISLNSFSSLKKGQECQLFLHQIVREDAHSFYGFIEKQERELFRLLISVSGVGANTARLILSSIPPAKLVEAIATNNVTVLKDVKGIGAKTAQKIIIDLKDKISGTSTGAFEIDNILGVSNNTLHKDTLNALVTLGFSKPNVEKVLNKILNDNSSLSLEETIKLALNYL